MKVPWGRQFVPLAGVNRARIMKRGREHPLLIEAILLEAIDAGHTVWGSEHPHIAWGLYEFATLLRDEGRLSEAEIAAREAFEMRQNVLGYENPETVKSLDVLTEILELEGKTAELEKLRREAAEQMD